MEFVSIWRNLVGTIFLDMGLELAHNRIGIKKMGKFLKN